MSAEEQKQKSLTFPLVTAAGILGTIEGFVWMLMSLAAVLLYTKVVENNLSSNPVDIAEIIYQLYLDNALTKPQGVIITPQPFSYFLYLYFVLSLLLLIASSALLWASTTGKGDRHYGKMLGTWTGTITLSSLLDFLLMCLIAHDYGKYSADTADLPPGFAKSTALTAVGIVMTLAIRGFTLWIVNIVMAVVLGKYCYNIYKKPPVNRSIINAYSSSRPWIGPSLYDDSAHSEFDNKGFEHDENTPYQSNKLPSADEDDNYYSNRETDSEKNIPRARDFPHVNVKRSNNDYYGQNRSQNMDRYGLSPRPFMEYDSKPNPYDRPVPLRTAKIGRQAAQRSPPLNIAPPFIPDPDYSPPGSPKIRGVLRPKSNYPMY